MLALAALVVVGIAGVIAKAESAGRTISAPAAITLGVVWAAGIAVVFRRMVAQLMSDTDPGTSDPPDG